MPSISLQRVSKQYNASVIAVGCIEAVVQALILNTNGFANAISALFRSAEQFHANDTIQMRARRLCIFSLFYGVSSSLSSIEYDRAPTPAQITDVINKLSQTIEDCLDKDDAVLNDKIDINRIEAGGRPIVGLVLQEMMELIRPFLNDFDELHVFDLFSKAVAEGGRRAFIRQTAYYAPIDKFFGLKVFAAERADEIWRAYNASLVSAFEKAPLFGDSENTNLMEVYQPLRVSWNDGPGAVDDPDERENARASTSCHLGMLDTVIDKWLESDKKDGRIKLISGGPGSGKSTSVRQIAARYAVKDNYRIILVPMQRLPAGGMLENRIADYFRFQKDEPFGEESPFATLGSESRYKWVVIFDGLDELAKEGQGAENAAQEFASSLIAWFSRVPQSADVCVLVSGRAPSMQDARRRMALEGRGTLNIHDMLPIKEEYLKELHNSGRLVDDLKVASLDQRTEFWMRYATAKKLSLTPPVGLKAATLQDLTKEPLLAYLLILSGYMESNWEVAADNRNHVYSAIFGKIWDRERSKTARSRLNDLSKECFLALLQSLALASWRENGRTGEESTFNQIRDLFIRPTLLKQAARCGIIELENVAVMFYTRRDEEAGRGFEFLHKSFAEYLIATAVVDMFCRLSKELKDEDSYFDRNSFVDKWCDLLYGSSMTSDIKSFVDNEIRLRFQQDALAMREETQTIASIISHILERQDVRKFISGKKNILHFVARYHSVLESLFGLMNGFAIRAYSAQEFRSRGDASWSCGPIRVEAFKDRAVFQFFLQRFLVNAGYSRFPLNRPRRKSKTTLTLPIQIGMIPSCLSRIDFSGCQFKAVHLGTVRASYCNFDDSLFQDARVTLFYSDHSSFSRTVISFSYIEASIFSGSTWVDAQIEDSTIKNCNFFDASFDAKRLKNTSFGGTILRPSMESIKSMTRRQKLQLRIHQTSIGIDRRVKPNSRRAMPFDVAEYIPLLGH